MPPAPRPVFLEVLAYIPMDFARCAYCERLLDAAEVSASAHREMQAAYAHPVVDPRSLEGFFKSLRYRVRRHPAFRVNRRAKHTAGMLPP